MAHESFEDPETAAIINERFISIKVDREERPDVDAVYMEAVQAMTGSGGWPLTAFLTPDGRPFFTGTYFPNRPAHGRPSFVQLCQAIDDAWRNRRDEIDEQAGRITEHLGRPNLVEAPAGEPPLGGPNLLAESADRIIAGHDEAWGGFGTAPKFPQTMSLDLLLRHHHHSGDDRALQVVTRSLDAMAAGGIHDHLGGGFARYSVDQQWLVPHFEKMLYDQALLARVYLHGWQVTGLDRYRTVLEGIVTYLLRDLRHPAGGFFSAEDADSEGEEGRFYVWTPDQVADVLGPDADVAMAWWGVRPGGNFEGATILNRLHGQPDEPEPPSLAASRQALLAARSTRVRPGLDDKVLTEWNALMLASLAEAGAATGTAAWVDAAVAGGEFLVANLQRPDGRWMRSWQDDGAGGQARHLALAVDHAALVEAFIALSEATGEARWIAHARQAADALLDLFWDDDASSFSTTGRDGEPLVAVVKDLLDNATPSANSLAATGLARLAALTGDDRYLDHARRVVELLLPTAARHSAPFGQLLAAADLLTTGIDEVAVVGDAPHLVEVVQRRYKPNAVLAWGEPYPSPLWEGRSAGLAYVCRDFACQTPVDSAEGLVAQLTSARGG